VAVEGEGGENGNVEPLVGHLAQGGQELAQRANVAGHVNLVTGGLARNLDCSPVDLGQALCQPRSL